MFEFAWPWLFWLLPLPWLSRWLLPAARNAERLWLPQASQLTPGGATSPGRTSRTWRQQLLLWLIWLLLLSAAAQPRWLGEPIQLQPEGREIMIALDLSGSMQMEDMELDGRRVSRLEAAHHILADFIRTRKGDRVGLIVYADEAFVYVPVTRDLETVAQLAEEAEVGLAGQRTALGDAIALSIRYFTERDPEDRVVLMLTDGIINTGVVDAEEAVRLAQANDVRIHTIGIGSEEFRLQGLFGEREVNPTLELDEVFLAAVAEASGGQYFRTTNTEHMQDVYAAINELEPVAGPEVSFQPWQSLVHWPLGAAILLLVLRLWQQHPIRVRLERGSHAD